MIRLLTIDGDRNRAQALAMECLEDGVAVRMAETLCEGVRYLLDAPVSLVLAEAGLLRMATSEQARLFEAVAPGVPVILTVDAGAKVEEPEVHLKVKYYLEPFPEPQIMLFDLNRSSHRENIGWPNNRKA